MIEPITAAQYNNNLTLIALDAVRHLAMTLNECYRKFWSRDTAVIVQSLNDNVTLALNRFHANTALGTALNAQLEAAGDALRVVVVMPDGYAFTDGEFIYTAPVVPEPEPEPEPQPEP